jgi:hypothetical protein
MGFANSISYGPETQLFTSGVTFGYTPGLTSPVREAIMSASAGGTIVLPPTNPTYPNPPGTPGYSPGSGDGLQITVNTANTQAYTIAVTSGDTLANGATLTGTVGLVASFISDASNSTWYKLAN